MHIIVIPVYNDWKSLNKLLHEINSKCNTKELIKILIVDDFSNRKSLINLKGLNKIKEIKILKLTENLGSQKAITVALTYLREIKSSFYATIMDSDGEDDPGHIEEMLDLAKKNKNRVIVSCRKDRKENLIIKFCYKIHLILTFFLTAKWISFGNFSSFHSKNIKKILLDNSSWHAYSAAIIKNANIKRTYSPRLKRYYDKSKVSFLFLMTHSIKIMGVFYNRIFIFSLFYALLINKLFKDFDSLILVSVLVINILIFSVIVKNYAGKQTNFLNFIKNIKIVK
jgi:hypothetical protein